MFDLPRLPWLSEYIFNNCNSDTRKPSAGAQQEQAPATFWQPTSSSSKMSFSIRRTKGLWILGVVFLILLVLSLVFEVADANDDVTSVEFAVRKVLSRRRAIDLAMDTDQVRLTSSQTLDDEKVQDEFKEENDEEGVQDDEDIPQDDRANMRSALVCLFGAVFSLHTLFVEHMKWDQKSFQRFSVATKIPVEIFCVSGPLVLVSAIIYIIMAGLLLLGGGSSSSFFIAASWSAIMIDMSFVCYSNAIYEIVTNKVDLILHVVNLVTAYNAFRQLRFFPYTFVICGLSFWGVVIGLRCVRRFRSGVDGGGGAAPAGNGFRPGSP